MAGVGSRPSRDALLGVIKAMHDCREWAASVPMMRALCRCHPEESEKARLRLATILIRELGPHTETRRHLMQIPVGRLDGPLEVARLALVAEADRMIEDGVLEVEEDA